MQAGCLQRSSLPGMSVFTRSSDVWKTNFNTSGTCSDSGLQTHASCCCTQLDEVTVQEDSSCSVNTLSTIPAYLWVKSPCQRNIWQTQSVQVNSALKHLPLDINQHQTSCHWTIQHWTQITTGQFTTGHKSPLDRHHCWTIHHWMQIVTGKFTTGHKSPLDRHHHWTIHHWAYITTWQFATEFASPLDNSQMDISLFAVN